MPTQSPQAIYDALTIDDVRRAADLFLPLYERTGGADGFVSLEVSPHLAHDTQNTVAEAHRLWERLDRLNVMIKVPATRAGLPAIRKLISDGINVNVTLLFSVVRYREVVEAFMAGLEHTGRARQAGGPDCLGGKLLSEPHRYAGRPAARRDRHARRGGAARPGSGCLRAQRLPALPE
ncbi:MAG: transaldolase family protein [Halioglobus sp.]|nr:transaldolase family protein [Halioglobus sp.]